MTTFVQITDLHIDNANAKLRHIDARRNASFVLDAIQDQGFVRVLITGDIAESEQGMDWFAAQLDERKLEYTLVPGNHDDKEYLGKVKLIPFPRSYYSLECEGFLLLLLDSGQGFIDEEQCAWIDEQIHNAPRNILISIHYPVLNCGDTIMDRQYPLLNRNAVLDILTSVQNRISIFCGHYHWDQTVEFKNIVQYVTPSTLYQLKKYTGEPEIDHEDIGYRILSIDDGSLETRVAYINKSSLLAG